MPLMDDGTVIECHQLGKPIADAGDVTSAELAWDDAGDDRVIVQVNLNSEASRRFLAHTELHVTERIALVSHGEILSAPTINDAIPGGELYVHVTSIPEGQRLVGELGGDPSKVPPRPSDTPRDAVMRRADRVCDQHRPSIASTVPLMLTSPMTAGDVTATAKQLLGRTVPPWDSLPADHFVVSCTYGAVSYLVDEEGRSSENPFSEIGAPSTP